MEIYISKSKLASDQHVELAKQDAAKQFADNNIEFKVYDFKKDGKYSSSIVDKADKVIAIPPAENKLF
jgi:hypothetical protein